MIGWFTTAPNLMPMPVSRLPIATNTTQFGGFVWIDSTKSFLKLETMLLPPYWGFGAAVD
jgi:hypothetical protein